MAMDQLPDKIEHIGIIVADMDKTRSELKALYGNLTGIDLVYAGAADRVWTDGNEIDEVCQCKLCVVEWINGVKIEIIQPVLTEPYGRNYEQARFLTATGGGLHHIAYYLTDGSYPEYRQLLLDRGGTPVFESFTDDRRGRRRCCYIRLPESRLLIEIAEAPKPASAEDAI